MSMSYVLARHVTGVIKFDNIYSLNKKISCLVIIVMRLKKMPNYPSLINKLAKFRIIYGLVIIMCHQKIRSKNLSS